MNKNDFMMLLDEYERITPGSGDIHDWNTHTHLLEWGIENWEELIGNVKSSERSWDDWKDVVFKDALKWIHTYRAKRV